MNEMGKEFTGFLSTVGTGLATPLVLSAMVFGGVYLWLGADALPGADEIGIFVGIILLTPIAFFVAFSWVLIPEGAVRRIRWSSFFHNVIRWVFSLGALGILSYFIVGYFSGDKDSDALLAILLTIFVGNHGLKKK